MVLLYLNEVKKEKLQLLNQYAASSNLMTQLYLWKIRTNF